MTEGLQEHFTRVVRDEAQCNDLHRNDFTNMKASYSEDKTYLTEVLAENITPERVVVGGEALDLYLDHAVRIPNVELDDPDTQATVERWATNDDVLVRVSKTTGEFHPATLAAQLKDRLGFVPGIRERRTARIANRALGISGMGVEEFIRPEVIDDEILWQLRWAAEHPVSPLDEANDPRQPINRYFIGYEGFPAQPSSLDEANIADKAEGLVSLDDLKQEQGYANFSPAEREAARERYQSLYRHMEGAMFLVAVEGLRTATEVFRHGQTVVPSRPQNSLPRYRILSVGDDEYIFGE